MSYIYFHNSSPLLLTDRTRNRTTMTRIGQRRLQRARTLPAADIIGLHAKHFWRFFYQFFNNFRLQQRRGFGNITLEETRHNGKSRLRRITVSRVEKRQKEDISFPFFTFQSFVVSMLVIFQPVHVYYNVAVLFFDDFPFIPPLSWCLRLNRNDMKFLYTTRGGTARFSKCPTILYYIA